MNRKENHQVNVVICYPVIKLIKWEVGFFQMKFLLVFQTNYATNITNVYHIYGFIGLKL